MKKLIIAAAVSLSCFSACVAPKEYTVRSYSQTFDGYWQVEAATRRKDSSFNITKDFLMPCAPDSVGSRFMYHPKDVVHKYRIQKNK
jgi:hypothetical protein